MEWTISPETVESGEQLETLRETLGLPEQISLLERGEAGEGAYTYSEAYTDENSVYHPGQIEGIYTDALDNPRVRELAGDLGQWQFQEKPMSCAVQCQRMVVNSVYGLEVTEGKLRELGERRNWYSDADGTYSHNVGRIAETYYAMERSQYVGLGLEELVALKEQGGKLILAVDHHRLARPDLNRPFKADHAVELLDFDFSDEENPKVILNDPGREEGMGSVYPLEIFLKAAGPTNFMGKTMIRHVTELRKGG